MISQPMGWYLHCRLALVGGAGWGRQAPGAPPARSSRRCGLLRPAAPDSDDIEASSMDSESKMDSSWKLERVRLAVSTVTSST
jgi:hypothetical protein